MNRHHHNFLDRTLCLSKLSVWYDVMYESGLNQGFPESIPTYSCKCSNIKPVFDSVIMDTAHKNSTHISTIKRHRLLQLWLSYLYSLLHSSRIPVPAETLISCSIKFYVLFPYFLKILFSPVYNLQHWSSVCRWKNVYIDVIYCHRKIYVWSL